jgi:hypothetical protein
MTSQNKSQALDSIEQMQGAVAEMQQILLGHLAK